MLMNLCSSTVIQREATSTIYANPDMPEALDDRFRRKPRYEIVTKVMTAKALEDLGGTCVNDVLTKIEEANNQETDFYASNVKSIQTRSGHLLLVDSSDRTHEELIGQRIRAAAGLGVSHLFSADLVIGTFNDDEELKFAIERAHELIDICSENNLPLVVLGAAELYPKVV